MSRDRDRDRDSDRDTHSLETETATHTHTHTHTNTIVLTSMNSGLKKNFLFFKGRSSSFRPYDSASLYMEENDKITFLSFVSRYQSTSDNNLYPPSLSQCPASADLRIQSTPRSHPPLAHTPRAFIVRHPGVLMQCVMLSSKSF